MLCPIGQSNEKPPLQALAKWWEYVTKNKVLEFVGDGVLNLSMEYRMGIDVMTTESAALSSIWCRMYDCTALPSKQCHANPRV